MNHVVNLFVCLVHEEPEVIWDMVRNLRHLDPTSHVLLYNNSGSPELLSDARFSSDQFVNIYPAPRRHSYGVLHGFMLDCMRWAFDNMEFDTITNVDSDQLLLSSGYSERIGRILQYNPDLGLLHSRAHAPEVNNRWVAYSGHRPVWSARREMTAWLPFLDKFEAGASKFPMWAFWPSSVFSRRSAQGILDCIDKNEYLRFLIKRTNIFGTEEIILPTLVCLLGYELVPTPFDETCFTWRDKYSMDLVEKSLEMPDRLWIHPVRRMHNYPLRVLIRNYHNNYGDLQ